MNAPDRAYDNAMRFASAWLAKLPEPWGPPIAHDDTDPDPICDDSLDPNGDSE